LYQSAENQATAPNSSMPWTRSNASQNRIPLFGDSQEQSKMGDLPIYQKHDKSDTAQTSGEEATETHPSAQSEVTLCAREGEDLVCATDDETRETLEPTIRRFPSQVSTSRDRRMNIREVDEHDDYGGALLSSQERDILSMLRTFHGLALADDIQGRSSCKV
jgi:hypothetical protein